MQSISTAFHGFYNTTEGASHFAYHFSPVLYLLAPLTLVTKSAIALIVVQAIAGALTIPPVYAIARRRMPALPATIVASIAALYPALGGVSFADFTENAFAPAATVWLLWSIDTRRMWASAGFAILCLSIKEDQTILMAWLGVAGAVYFTMRNEKHWAIFCLGIAILAGVTATAFLTIVRPASGVAYGYPSIRDFYGGTDPIALLHDLLTAPKAAYLFAALVPLLAVCLLSHCMLLAIPGLLECLLSRVPSAYTIGQHYAAVWVPYVLVAFAVGAAVLWRNLPRAGEPVLALALAISVWMNVGMSPNDWAANLSARTPEHAAIERFIATLPKNASITAFCSIYAHLGAFPGATVYAKSPTDFVAIYAERDIAAWDAAERNYVVASHRYGLLEKIDGLEIYRRR